MRLPLLPTASDLAILAGALMDTRPARTARAAVSILPAIGIILALVAAAKIDEWARET